MAVTIRDVARKCGVAVSTVSRALNGYSDITEETREKILKAVEELDYKPNLNARNLSSKKSNRIALIISGLLENNPKENLTFRLIQGVYSYTYNHDLDVAVYATDAEQQGKISYEKFCTEHDVCGVILSGVTMDDPYFRELINTEIPCVAIDVELPDKRAGWVSIDNTRAMSDMVNLLYENGHERILVVSGKKNAGVTVDRMTGVFDAMQKKGRRLRPKDILYCDYSEEKAYEETAKYLQKYGKREHTAILCFSDLMALGVMRAVKEAGYRIGEDFSVTGFDGIPITEYTDPPLTTVWQDMKANGYEGAKLLQDRIEGKKSASHSTLPYKLLNRKSVRNICCLLYTSPSPRDS